MTHRRYSRLRFLTLLFSFLLLVAIPILNLFNITFLQGWYQSLGIGDLWIVSPLEGLESILVSKGLYFPTLVGMLVPVVLAVVLGRVFCSWVCPISFLSECLDYLKKAVFRADPPKDRWVLPLWILWFSLIGELLISMILGSPVFVFLSPPALVGRELMLAVVFRTLALEGIVILLVLGLHLVTRRFYCRYLCPLGALLALLGSWRRLRIRLRKKDCSGCALCDEVCPLGLKVLKGEAAGTYCWNCGECVERCPHRALKFVV